MNIIEKINHKKNDLAKKIMLLELDERFKSLVNILKQKEIIIEETFLNKQSKQDFNWQEYYANLCLFIDQDVATILKLYQEHEHDNLSIYDDSKPEITDKLLAKVKEIKDTITKVTEEYHDEVLTNYLTNKYHLIMESYQESLHDILKRNEISLKNNLTGDYQEPMPLTIYNNCTLVKERCLETLNEVLNDFITYINSLSENKRIINEKEQTIISILDKLKDNQLLQQFDLIKNNYYQSITNINSIDIRIGSLQKNYFQELDNFYQLLLQKEAILNEQNKLISYFNYLNQTDLYQIKFTKLFEIKDYLEKNPNFELETLLLNIYYQIIKLELRYNNGTSSLYNKLSNRHKLVIEKLFINDLKEYQTMLLEQDNYKEFLTNDFSLELLNKFANLTITTNPQDILNNYQDILTQKPNIEVISYLFNNSYFDNSGEVLLKRKIDDRYYFYIANQSGHVKEITIDLLKKYSKNDPFYKVSYSNGIIIYHHCGIKMNHSIHGESNFSHDGKIIEDITNNTLINIDRPMHLEKYEHYSDGLIKVTIQIFPGPVICFTDKYGNRQFTLDKKISVASHYSNGYLLTITKDKRNREFVEYLNHQGKVCYRYKLKDSNYSKIYSFDKGLLYIAAEDKIVNTSFEEVFSDYNYHIIKNKLPESFRQCSVSKKDEILWCLKSKINGQTYLYENGKLIPMTEQEIIDRESVENYVLIKEGSELRFVRKDIYLNNSILDIVKQEPLIESLIPVIPKINNNQNNSNEIIYFKGKTYSKHLFDNDVNMISYQNNKSKILNKKY